MPKASSCPEGSISTKFSYRCMYEVVSSLQWSGAAAHQVVRTFPALAGQAVVVEQTPPAVCTFVGEDLVDHPGRDQRGLSILHRVGDGPEGGVEVRVLDAAL